MNRAGFPRTASRGRSTLLAFLAAACVAAATAFVLSAAAADPPIPAPTGYVTDAAGVLGALAARTETLCRRIEKDTTAEVAVLTVPTTAPLPIEEYARLVFEKWKVGKKGKDNGVLIVVAVSDRKMWIATGYGVEGILPDGKVGEIRDRVIVPFFRRGAFGRGIYEGVAEIGSVLSGGRLPGAGGEAARGAGRQAPTPRWITPVILFMALFPLFLVFGLLGWRARRGAARPRGVFWGGPFVGGGFGGGFGGGGFGGFGGGSFGGGGAGGSW